MIGMTVSVAQSVLTVLSLLLCSLALVVVLYPSLKTRAIDIKAKMHGAINPSYEQRYYKPNQQQDWEMSHCDLKCLNCRKLSEAITSRLENTTSASTETPTTSTSSPKRSKSSSGGVTEVAQV